MDLHGGAGWAASPIRSAYVTNKMAMLRAYREVTTLATLHNTIAVGCRVYLHNTPIITANDLFFLLCFAFTFPLSFSQHTQGTRRHETTPRGPRLSFRFSLLSLLPLLRPCHDQSGPAASDLTSHPGWQSMRVWSEQECKTSAHLRARFVAVPLHHFSCK